MPAADPGAEWAALEGALATTAADIRVARATVVGPAGEYEAGIFDAHLLFLEDEALLGPARARIFGGGASGARAWADAVREAAAAWDALDDAYLRARAADLRGLGDQVLRHLLGLPPATATPAEGIVVAGDLSPAQAAALDRGLVRGVVSALGGPTSHGAILARALGIPAVVGAGRQILSVAEGTPLVLDGEAGTVTVDPPPAVVLAARERRDLWMRRQASARRGARSPAVTLDGLSVRVDANVAAPGDVPAALAAGADGVGLLRTEFLFLESARMPGEDEQESAYRVVAEALEGRPLTLRTLDAGADKRLPYLPLAAEQNPYLGVRGIRLGLEHPDLLAAQLRAALRVAADHPLRIMFPMVTTVDELRRAREILEEAAASLRAAGVAAPARVEAGIMVEVPAAALTIEALVPHAHFFSLGTNDLAQYVLAADRGNGAVAALADALHPAVLQLIGRTAEAGARGGRAVAVCGELAGDPQAIPLLVGLGVAELSMSPARIAAAKEAVRATDAGDARRLARQALAAGSAGEVRALIARASR